MAFETLLVHIAAIAPAGGSVADAVRYSLHAGEETGQMLLFAICIYLVLLRRQWMKRHEEDESPETTRASHKS
jgi:hypothetical protein